LNSCVFVLRFEVVFAGLIGPALSADKHRRSPSSRVHCYARGGRFVTHELEQFVHEDVNYNDRRIGLSGYREMLERDFFEIPDLYFNIHLLISNPPHIASRLGFDCTPKGKFLGLDVNGKRISFTENVFYEFRSEKIGRVWSVIDKAAIEAQL
jgi:predicted ester cyclase